MAKLAVSPKGSSRQLKAAAIPMRSGPSNNANTCCAGPCTGPFSDAQWIIMAQSAALWRRMGQDDAGSPRPGPIREFHSARLPMDLGPSSMTCNLWLSVGSFLAVELRVGLLWKYSRAGRTRTFGEFSVEVEDNQRVVSRLGVAARGLIAALLLLCLVQAARQEVASWLAGQDSAHPIRLAELWDPSNPDYQAQLARKLEADETSYDPKEVCGTAGPPPRGELDGAWRSAGSCGRYCRRGPGIPARRRAFSAVPRDERGFRELPNPFERRDPSD
jgi:hypothetical protein